MTRQLIFFERNRKLLLLIFKLEFVGPTRIAEWRNGARETKNKTGAKRREEKNKNLDNKKILQFVSSLVLKVRSLSREFIFVFISDEKSTQSILWEFCSKEEDIKQQLERKQKRCRRRRAHAVKCGKVD